MSEYYSIAPYSSELYHHGIKGQKWGVRRFQNKDGSLTSAGRKRLKTGTSSKKSKPSNDIGKALARTVLSRSERVGDIDPELVDVGIELAAYALTIAAYFGLVAHKINKTFETEIKRNKENSGKFSDLKRTKVKSKEYDMKVINPEYGKSKGTTTNCVLCSTAYELRRRGYDVQANYSDVGRRSKDMCRMFNLDEKSIPKAKTRTELAHKLQAYPDGSRGTIFVNAGPYASRHAMVWENERGKVVIRDCQTNTVYRNIFDSIIVENPPSRPYEIYRTDNATINEDAIMDAVMNRRR